MKSVLSVSRAVSILFIYFFFFSYSYSQEKSWYEKYRADSIKQIIGKDIFRVHVASAFIIPGYGDVQLLGNYETRVSRDISFNTRAGFCFQFLNANTATSSRTQTTMGCYLFASAELKYFFLTQSRIASKRKVANYSGFYIGTEQNLLSAPIFLQNISANKTLDAKTAFYLNLGFQKQIGNLFFNWSVGASPFRVNLSKKDAYLVPAQSWLTLGYVFGSAK